MSQRDKVSGRHGDDRKTRMHWKNMEVYVRKDRELLESFWRAQVRAYGEVGESSARHQLLGDSYAGFGGLVTILLCGRK